MRVLPLAAVALSLLAVPAFAHEERIQHYEGTMPKTAAEAKEALVSSSQAVIAAIRDKKLEAAHEATYTTENAIKVLQDSTADAAKKKALSDLAVTVEEIHLASEEGEQAKCEGLIPTLEQQVKAVQGL